jgi:Tfp pilus assembly protein FimV
MMDQRTAAIDAAKAAAQAATAARVAECQKRGSKCRELEHAEQARMSELQSAIAAPVPTVPTITEADPQVAGAVRLASWAGLNLTATDVGNLRLALMGLLPNLAGLVLAFGVALRGAATRR